MNTEIDISNVVLHTERLELRPWKQEDLDDFYAYASEDGVGQMAGWIPHESREISQKILDSFIKGKKTFAIILDGHAVGSIGIEKYNETKFPEFNDEKGRELGFVLRRESWGQGLMPEAVKEVIKYLFNDVGVDFIACGHFVWNKQSGRVQEKCGFKPYKTIPYTTQAGKEEESVESILKRDEWKAEYDA